jgi:hypothetical protein
MENNIEENENKECCPVFNPQKWDKKIFKWKNKLFITESIPQIFHIPFFPMIGKKIVKMMNLAKSANKIDSKKDEVLIMFHDPHAFKSEIFFSVTGEVPGANNVKLSGTFITKVCDGPNRAIPRFIKEMDAHLASKGEKAEKYYIHYAYCPKCEKKYGHHYMILFAKVQ